MGKQLDLFADLRLLCLQQIPKPDDVADALAMAICHGQVAGSSLRQALLGRRS